LCAGGDNNQHYCFHKYFSPTQEISTIAFNLRLPPPLPLAEFSGSLSN